MAIMMKERENVRPDNSRRIKNNPNENQNEKIAHPVGKSYDFWKCEGDSIYDELYGDSI
ncbi:hypothetical protein [Cytobacillus praedii]